MTGWISDFMNHPATYLKTGWLQISVSNLIVIVLMLIIFALAILVQFPKDKEGHK
jgi:E3 ubiquitin-protein ligase DOA10